MPQGGAGAVVKARRERKISTSSRGSTDSGRGGSGSPGSWVGSVQDKEPDLKKVANELIPELIEKIEELSEISEEKKKQAAQALETILGEMGAVECDLDKFRAGPGVGKQLGIVHDVLPKGPEAKADPTPAAVLFEQVRYELGLVKGRSGR